MPSAASTTQPDDVEHCTFLALRSKFEEAIRDENRLKSVLPESIPSEEIKSFLLSRLDNIVLRTDVDVFDRGLTPSVAFDDIRDRNGGFLGIELTAEFDRLWIDDGEVLQLEKCLAPVRLNIERSDEDGSLMISLGPHENRHAYSCRRVLALLGRSVEEMDSDDDERIMYENLRNAEPKEEQHDQDLRSKRAIRGILQLRSENGSNGSSGAASSDEDLARAVETFTRTGLRSETFMDDFRNVLEGRGL